MSCFFDGINDSGSNNKLRRHWCPFETAISRGKETLLTDSEYLGNFKSSSHASMNLNSCLQLRPAP